MTSSADETRVLYLGDGRPDGAASYLAGVLATAGISFRHIPSAAPFPEGTLDGPLGAVVVSDYPKENFSPCALDALCRAVEGGLGLFMIGGWRSFAGFGRGYETTPVADVLPVRMLSRDDRQNTWSPCVVVPGQGHPHEITADLPLDGDLPCVAGFNRLERRESGIELLRVRLFGADPTKSGGVSFVSKAEHPLLVVGEFGRGRVACFASDVAPHWVGGLVDWGSSRIPARAEGFNEVEFGCAYGRLFANAVRWVLGASK